MNSTADTNTTKPRRFQRSKDDKVIAGVAGGLGEYFGVDPVLFRVGLVAAAIMSAGFVAIAYIALALMRDQAPAAGDSGDTPAPVEPTAPTAPPAPVAA